MINSDNDKHIEEEQKKTEHLDGLNEIMLAFARFTRKLV